MRPEDMNYQTDLPPLSGLYHKYCERSVAIIGGGPTVLSDLAATDSDSLIISINHYTHLLDIECDYMVYADNPNITAIGEAAKRNVGKRVSIYQPWSDFDIDVQPYFTGMSVEVAIWLGCYITNGTVYLCGFDCCTSRPTHFTGFHNEEEYNKPLANKMNPILNAIKNVGDRSRIVALQEPLKGVL